MNIQIQIALITESLLLLAWALLYIYSRVLHEDLNNIYSYARFLVENKNIGFYIQFFKTIAILYPILFTIGYILAHFYTWLLFNLTF